MRRMKKARQYLLGIFAALLLCGIFSVNTVKADTQYVYDNASLLSDEGSRISSGPVRSLRVIRTFIW